MKKALLALLLLPVFASGQGIMYYSPFDSVAFTFTPGNHLTDTLHIPGNTFAVSIDTSGATLWQIGSTLKPVFSDLTTRAAGIMTDTVNPYPPGANDYFTLEVNYIQNSVISIWHEYQTDSIHAGGIIEFSTDSGATWMNVANCSSINKANFYSIADTVFSGAPAFTGNSSGQMLTQFQILDCFGISPPTTACSFYTGSGPFFGPLYIRFRFVSDTTVSALPGWKIDSIRVDYMDCPGSASNIKPANTFSISPNPAAGHITLSGAEGQITIINLMGQTVRSLPAGQAGLQLANGSLQVAVDISDLPAGVYFVKGNGGTVQKFVKN